MPSERVDASQWKLEWTATCERWAMGEVIRLPGHTYWLPHR